MDSELINIFNDQREPIGVATRKEVHKHGYWHEAFHCWFISRDELDDYIYLQLRSEHKRDYPNLFDITAAGHLLFNESVADGIREIKEETGIDVAYHELISLGILDYVVVKNDFIDKEIAHVYLHNYNRPLDDFTVQSEEVSGMFMTRFSDFYELWMGQRDQIDLQGFVMDEQGNRIEINKVVEKVQFVPHDEEFYKLIVDKIKSFLEIEEGSYESKTNSR